MKPQECALLRHLGCQFLVRHMGLLMLRMRTEATVLTFPLCENFNTCLLTQTVCKATVDSNFSLATTIWDSKKKKKRKIYMYILANSIEVFSY